MDWTHGIDGGAERGDTPKRNISERRGRAEGAPKARRNIPSREHAYASSYCESGISIGMRKREQYWYKKLLLGVFSGPSAFIIANFAAKFGTRILGP